MELFDLTKEQPISLHDAVKYFPKSPRGKQIYWRTIERYILHGHLGVFLEGNYVADRLATSVDSISRFATKCSAKRATIKAAPANTKKSNSSRAYLESQGLKKRAKAS